MVIPIDTRLPGERERELFAISIFYSEYGKNSQRLRCTCKDLNGKSAGSANVENSLYIKRHGSVSRQVYIDICAARETQCLYYATTCYQEP